MNVLIAEELRSLQNRLGIFISDCSLVYGIEYTSNIDDTMKIINEHKIDAIILSLKLLRDRGIEIIKKLSEKVPLIIVLVSNSIPQYRTLLTEAGADFVFDDSLDFELIPEVLRA